MSKFRIVKVEAGPNHYFLLEKKHWLWGWQTIKDGSVDDIGPYEYDKKFKSEEEAYDYYTRWYEKSYTTIIKEWENTWDI